MMFQYNRAWGSYTGILPGLCGLHGKYKLAGCGTIALDCLLRADVII
jgi:hypothetical protein